VKLYTNILTPGTNGSSGGQLVGVAEGHLRLIGCEDGHPQRRSRSMERSPTRVDSSLCESGTAHDARKYEHVMNAYSRLRV